MEPLLDATAQELLNDERRVLERILDLLDETGAFPDMTEQLQGMVEGLDELFLVVVVGEFNAGKSKVLNALFGKKVMEEGPIPTTDKITILRYGEDPLTRPKTEFLEERRLPDPLLRHLTLVDTPGTNSIVKQHQKITEDFVPRSDLVLFVTSYDRPLTESERQFLSFIRDDWGRELIFVLNKADLAEDESDLRSVVRYVKSGCQELLGFDPQVMPVSARQAFRAKTTGGEGQDAAMWEESGFAPLEEFLRDTLAGPERVALKLTAPLQTAERILDRLRDHLDERKSVLKADQKTLDDIHAQAEEARSELRDSYERQIAEIDNLLLQMRSRGVEFLDDTIRASFSKLRLLRNRERFKEQFAQHVIGDTDRQIESVVTDAIDGLMHRTTALQSRLFQAFAERVRATGREHDIEAEQSFAYDRSRVFRATMQQAERRMEAHDLRKATGRIVDNAYDAAGSFLGTGAGAAGLGLVGLMLVIAPVLDVIGGLGLASGAALALIGSTILPRQRKKAIEAFTERVDELREDMKAALQEQLNDEVDAALERVLSTIEPFASFVETERTVLKEASGTHATLRDEVERLQTTVEQEVGRPQT